MLHTQKDIEDYIYNETNDKLKDFIGKPIDNSTKSYFDYLSKNIEMSMQNLIPIGISTPDIKISIDDYDKTVVNIKIIPKPSPWYQYSLNLNTFDISNKNLDTHNLNGAFISNQYQINCTKCGYQINKDSSGYFSYVGDYSCDEYIIKNIIE